MSETILLTISACNERDLHQTIKSALISADVPENLYFDIITHDFYPIDHDLDNLTLNINHIKLSYGGPLGVGKARMYSQLIGDRKQNYHLQVDAHMIFEKHWDTDIVNNYKNILKVNNIDKAIISAYVPYWYGDAEDKPRLHNGDFIDPYNYIKTDTIYNGKIEFKPYDPNHFVKSVSAGPVSVDWSKHPNGFIEQYTIVGHYVFGPISMLEDVLPDPMLVFEGEELSYAIRLWTRGYRIFSIKDTLLLHKNKLGRDPDKKDWRTSTNVPDKSKNEQLWGNYHASLVRAKKIATGEILGYWGSPTKELLDDYQTKAGIDFKAYYFEIKGL
jgi:hypothetical protein